MPLMAVVALPDIPLLPQKGLIFLEVDAMFRVETRSFVEHLESVSNLIRNDRAV